MPHSSRRPSDWEFIALTAFMMSLVALAIDMMLPALPLISADLGVNNPNDRQMIISVFMGGLTLSQIIYGPWSDKVGRKPAIAVGSLVYLTGSLICFLAQDFNAILIGRALQGCGVAALRILSITIVRDLYQGRDMARIMSVVMSLFILVPCIAPMAGQITLSYSHWRTIFVILALAGALILVWFWLRQPETLSPDNRRPFNPATLWQGFRETCSHRQTLGYTLAMGVISGAFTGYLLSAQQIFQDVFHAGERFALYFAILALVYGAASLLNSRLVGRLGMQRLCFLAITGLIGFSLIFLSYALIVESRISLVVYMGLMIAIFFCFSFLFGNINAIAMQPLGHLAGTASSMISLISGVVSLAIGASIGQAFNGTVIPLVAGTAVCSIAALVMMKWAGTPAAEQQQAQQPDSLDKAA